MFGRSGSVRGLRSAPRVSLLSMTAVAYWAGLVWTSLVGATVGPGLLALGLGLLGCARALVPMPLARERWLRGLLMVAALSAGAGTEMTRPSPTPQAGLYRLVADVERVHHGRDTVSSVLVVVSGERVGDGQPMPPGVRLRARPVALPEGARVKLLAQVQPEQPFRNPTPHPPLPDPDRASARAWISQAAGVAVVAHNPVARGIDRTRTVVRTALVQTLSPEASGVARALVLGDMRAVDAQDAQIVRDAGLSHVLAVSGLHVTLVVGAWVALIRLLLLCTRLALRWEVRRIACAAGVVLVFVYAPLSGGSASAWRAAVTAAVAWSLIACGRRPSAAAVTASAALLLAAFDPAQVWDVGFVLSIVATAALVSLPRQEVDPRWWHHVQATAVVSVRAFVATAPVLLWTFGTLSWIGVLANLVLVPLSSVLLLPAVLLHAVVASCLPGAAMLTRGLAQWTIDGFMAAAGWFARVPGLSPPPPSIAQGLTLALLCAGWLLVRSMPARVWLSVACVIALGVGEWHLRVTERPHDGVRATFLDVGQGDSALIDLPDGRLMLIDAGGNPHGGIDPGQAVLVPMLRARRRDRIDVVVITHPHPDHFGGLRAIVDAGIGIGELWDNGQADAEEPEGAFSTQLRELARSGVVVRRPAELCARPWRFGAAQVRVLWPCPRFDAGLDANDNSLVLRIDHGSRSFLWTGDVEALAERALVSSPRVAMLDADVLKVPHHGSRTSSSEAFLAAVSPSIAVVSAGAFNRYGHPHTEVQHRLLEHAEQLLRLDQQGGSVVHSDGHVLAVTPPVTRPVAVPTQTGLRYGTQYMP